MNQIPKRRSMNKLKTPIGIHWTIQKVLTKPNNQKRFGFAISDGGDIAFMPWPVIVAHNITTEDIGTGFTAPTKSAAEGVDGEAYSQIQLPLQWDEGVEEPQEDPVVLADLETLLFKMETLEKVDVFIGQELTETMKSRDRLVLMRETIGETLSWLDENYPRK